MGIERRKLTPREIALGKTVPRYTDQEARLAMGEKSDSNPYNHDKYGDADVAPLIAAHAANEDAHHNKDHTHSEYVNKDGSVSFEAPVSGVTPTISTHLVTKNYADTLISNLKWKEPVVDDQTTPPVSPILGERYIVLPTGTGDWSGHDNEIAEWNGSSWTFYSPVEGWALRKLTILDA